MASAKLDLYIVNAPDSNLTINTGYDGRSSELRSIGQGVQVTLQRGSVRRTVVVRFQESGERLPGHLEVGAALARLFRLRPGVRYELTYEPRTRTLRIAPAPVSDAAAVYGTHAFGARVVSVGYELLAALGIPERSGASILVVCGSRSAVPMRLRIPANLLDNRLLLPGPVGSSWGLVPGRTYPCRYNQQTRTLHLTPRRG